LDSPIRLEGATNFRSLNGLVARDGRHLRPHRLMRSDRLHGLTPSDWGALRDLEIATICDLRSDLERERHPNRTPADFGAREITAAIDNDLRADPQLFTLLADHPTKAGADRLMIELYRRFAVHFAPRLPQLVEALLGGGPMLLHCTAGKDRTGFAMALILTALDVPREAIMEDYLASNAWPGAALHRDSLRRRLSPHNPGDELEGMVDTLLRVREAYLDTALGEVERRYGSVLGYLQREASLDAARRARLQDLLLI
jgi:protein-tyrosine phosphatase